MFRVVGLYVSRRICVYAGSIDGRWLTSTVGSCSVTCWMVGMVGSCGEMRSGFRWSREHTVDEVCSLLYGLTSHPARNVHRILVSLITRKKRPDQLQLRPVKSPRLPYPKHMYVCSWAPVLPSSRGLRHLSLKSQSRVACKPATHH